MRNIYYFAVLSCWRLTRTMRLHRTIYYRFREPDSWFWQY